MPLAWDNFNHRLAPLGFPYYRERQFPASTRSSSSFNPSRKQRHDSRAAAAPSTLSDVAALHHRYYTGIVIQ